MAKKALITGITGQDGSYLTEYLLSLGYEVYGLIRRNSVTEHQRSRLEHVASRIHNQYGDLSDQGSLDRILREVKPDEIYNLASQSHVRISFEIPQYTALTNAFGTLNLLESMRVNAPQAHLYQASSSEMFGNSVDSDMMQRETTPMDPVSPYGCSKLFAYNFLRTYRRSYNLFLANGILFNHESPRRGSNFVTTKIMKNAVLIANGKLDKLELGNLEAKRDWGHSADYVRAMHMIVNHDIADDFVISTGEAHSVRELCEIVFSRLGLDYRDHVVQNPKYFLPQELDYLCGDCSKAKSTLNWEPKYTFSTLVEEMVDFWIHAYEKNGGVQI